MRFRLKTQLANLLSTTGILAITRILDDRHNDLVLTLHRVLPDQECRKCYDQHLVLSTRVFEDLLIYLQQHCQVVSLNTLLTGSRASNDVQRIALTFDDGWRDTFMHAFPLLVRYRIPATVFICTSLIGSCGMLPEERLARIFDHCTANDCIPSFLQHLTVWGGAERLSASEDWRSFTRTIPMTAKLSLTTHLEGVYGLERTQEEHLMNWEDVQTMAACGIEIGSHTANHATLSVENRLSIERELKDSRDVIALKLGASPRYLSYPDGAHNQSVTLLAEEAGYSHAFTSAYGSIDFKEKPFALPRIAMDSTLIMDETGRLNPARMALQLSPLRRLLTEPKQATAGKRTSDHTKRR
jgi:peptidoglycan/xylan/chitin deacetylase (PgdA/CDA1 family)